jgi:stage II sporulation protein D
VRCVVRRGRWCVVLVVMLGIAAPEDLGLAHIPGTVMAQDEMTDRTLEVASDGRTVRIGPASGGRVLTVPLEVYVARVVAGEADPRALDHAMRALAIAIRTYAMANLGRHRADGFDLCDSTHCQVPRTPTAATRRAAFATAGRVLTHEGKPAEVFYSASCGGHSESASQVWPAARMSYLRSVPDDVHEDDQPWTIELTLEDVQRAMSTAGYRGRLTGMRVEARNESGRVTQLRLEGLNPDLVGGVQLRNAVGPTVLRSTLFSVGVDGARARFTGVGYGHGVGMCVVGAGRRARRGEDVDTILAQYYPGLEIGSLGDRP